MTDGDGRAGDSHAEDCTQPWSSPAVDRFFVTDRTVGWVAGSASLAATQLSAGTLVGTVGIHYAVGISFLAIWPGIWLGWLVSMVFIAPQLRRFGGVTVPDYLAARFDADGADGRRTRALAATLIAVVYLVYTAAQYVAGAVILETVLGVPRAWGMTALVVVVLGYTLVGGMRASVLTDVVQTLLLVVGAVTAAALGLSAVGGVGSLVGQAVAVDPSLLGWGMSPTTVAGFALAFGLGMAVAPYEVSRIYAMADTGTVTTAIWGSIAIQAVVAGCVAVLGLVARVRFPSLTSPDSAVAVLAQSLLGPVGGGLLLLAVLAAILSTVDSVLLVSASALAYDLYGAVLRPAGMDGLTDADDVLVAARGATVLAAVVPFGLAGRADLLGGLVQLIVALYASLVAGTLFAPVVLGLHWDGATTAGGLAAIVTGFGTVVGWHVLTDVTGTVTAPLSAAPPVAVGVLASTTALAVVSRLRPASPAAR